VLQENTKPNTQIKNQVESEIEASIFKIWTEVIGHENFSLTDNFFDAGGHSVLFLKVKERLETMFGMDFSIIELYQYPNIKSIADEYRKRYANIISDKAKKLEIEHN
ncbi:phosphopantetheine-binding protein, partial [bacterium]|nr:phosphopantetheine-binding protein [bacterium]